jgi:ABC-type xylose transport system substrate-binding protein
MAKLTLEQRIEILDKSLAASQSGNDAEALRIGQQKPLTPWIAKAVKEIFGVEYLRGWDLSDAEAEYGQNWLSE